jgi:transposase-like protein
MNVSCPFCHHSKTHSHGTFVRKSDSKTLIRYRCAKCYKTFSQATFSENYRQNKRRLNPLVLKLLSSGVSQRRMALILKTTSKTIARKLVFLGKLSKLRHHEFLQSLSEDDLQALQFDDLITSHHTKLKPVSVSVVVSKQKRKILACEISQIPAFGHLAQLSVKKYGKRRNELPKKLDQIFKHLSSILPENGHIDSDEHKLYPDVIKKHLPKWKHHQYPSIRASVAGQGELKRKINDPLFPINHSLAMLRANLNRLFRRTWCTTKNLERLEHHLWIYIGFHNQYLTQK